MRKRIFSMLLTLCMLCTLLPVLPVQAANEIKVGDYVQMGVYNDTPILWRCVAVDDNGPLMLADKAIGTMQADEAGSLNTEGSHIRRLGGTSASNYWGDSNIRTWLNSGADAGAVEWIGPQPDYSQEAGFLSNFDPAELSAVKEVTQKSILASVDSELFGSTGTELFKFNFSGNVSGPGIYGLVSNYDRAYAEQLTEKMFLLDVKQVYAVFENSDVLGEDYYRGAYNLQDENGEKVSYWLRTPNPNNADSMIIANSNGVFTAAAANNNAVGVRPAFYLDTQRAILNSGDGTAADPYKRLRFGGKSEFVVNGVPGENITADLSEIVEYEDGTPTAGRFTYTIEGENTINASIDGDILTVPKGLEIGEYPLTVKAVEDESRYALASVEDYAYLPVTTNIRIKIHTPGDIQVGEYLQMGEYDGKPIVWRCVDVDDNGPLMLADKAICVKQVDAGNALYSASHANRSPYDASNYWGDSDMRTWLNSDEPAGFVEWHANSWPPYSQEAGFLTNFTSEEMRSVKAVTQKSILSRYDFDGYAPAPYVVNSASVTGTEFFQYFPHIRLLMRTYDDAYAEELTDTMFLLDAKQLYAVYENGDILGEDYYAGAYNSQDDGGEKISYWLRTPTTERVEDFRGVSSDGRIESYAAESNLGVRPAFYFDTQSVNYQSGDGTAENPYLVRRVTFGVEDPIEIVASYGYGDNITADLSKYMAYVNKIDTAGKFTYTIEGENTIDASIEGDTLTIPKGLIAGEYSLTVKAVEKEPKYMLASVDTYGTEPVALNIKVIIEKAAPTASVWANELVFKDREQYLVTGKTDDGTLVYSMSEDGEYSEKIPTGKEVGDYIVWYKVIGDYNHADSAPRSITVSIKNIVGISIGHEPTKTTVLEGMPFDASGLTVIADCGDGETFEARGYTLSGYDTSKTGVQTVTVAYAGKTAEFKITVEAKSLTSIELTHRPDKLTYYQGDKLDITGMVVTAFYNNNTSEFVNNDDCVVSGLTDKAGEQTVTVTYNGQSAEFIVAVLERPVQTQTVETPLIETADFYGGKRVIISCATEGADIYYTTDGSNPTASSNKYTAPIELTESASIKAIAVKSGMDDSNVVGETVTVEKVSAPVASVTGEVEVGTSVKLLCTTPGAEIYYSFGDSVDEDNYKKYTGEIVITGSMKIRAIAAKRGYAMSDGVTFEYTAAPPEEEPGETNRALLDAGETMCKAGKTFRLPAYIYSERAIADFRFTLSFDSDKFEYVGFEAGEDVPVSDVSVTADETGVTVRGTVNDLTAAEVCVLVFKAKSDVEADDYLLPVSDIEINTADGSLTEIWYLEGLVSIISEDTNIFADAYLTDSEDNILEDMADVKGDLTAYILAQMAEVPEDGETISCDLILAFYDTDGALVKITTTEAELSGEMDFFEVPITIPENTEIGDVKLMAWDKTGTMKPLMEAAPVVYPYGYELGE